MSGTALAGLLTSEASAAIPETLLPSILATVKGAAATTATATAVPGVALGAKTGTTTAAMLAKGAMKMMFIAKVKMVAAVVAAVVVTGATVPVGIAVAQAAKKEGISHMAVKMEDEAAASTQEVVRFIRLKYDGPGWDDGLDESGADRNFLERFGQLTGFKVSKNGDAHPIKLLAKYPKGFAPAFVFITGTGEINSSDEEVHVLQAYLAGGGMLWADCGGPKWDTTFRALMMRVFPDEPLRDIPDEDPLFSAPFKFPNGAPPLWQHGGKRALGIKLQDRWAVFYHPGDMNDAWKTGHSGLSDAAAQPAFELGVNIVNYALKTQPNPAKEHARGHLFVPDYEVPDYPTNSLPEAEATLLGEADKRFAKKEPKEYELAAAAYDSFVLKYPKSKAVPYALIRKGRSLQFVGKRSEAIKIYGAVLDYFVEVADLAPALLYVAQSHYLNGNVKEATKAIAQLRADKDYGKHEAAACATFLLARIQAEGGKTDDAISTLAAIAVPFPAYAALAQLRKAEVYEKAGRTAEAVAAYQATLKKFPGTQEADLAHSALEKKGNRAPAGAHAEP